MNAARVGGWSLIGASIAFIGVFTYLAARFAYPDVLDGRAVDVLPALLGMGGEGRAVWALYGLLPLLLVPAGIGADAVLRERTPALGRAALVLAAVSAFAMMMGLLRWPSIHWSLAEAYVATADDSQRMAIAAMFDGLNVYLGNFIGEFVGELTLNLFFLVVAIGALREPALPRWSAWMGVAAACAGLIGMFRNVTPVVAMVAEIENAILPLWMLALGLLLVRAGGRRA